VPALSKLSSLPLTTEGDGWKPFETAPKDGSYILALYGVDGDRERWGGRAFVVRHEGVDRGYDLGWALFPGYGGVSDRYFSHWMPLPDAPSQSPDQSSQGNHHNV
jgi:hypothetical protein